MYVLSSGRRVQEAVTAGIECEWRKFKNIESVLCKRVMSLKLRGSMYESCVGNALWYGTECRTLKKYYERKLQTTETRMLRVICGKILKDSIRNETIREMIGEEKIEKF